MVMVRHFCTVLIFTIFKQASKREYKTDIILLCKNPCYEFSNYEIKSGGILYVLIKICKATMQKYHFSVNRKKWFVVTESLKADSAFTICTNVNIFDDDCCSV